MMAAIYYAPAKKDGSLFKDTRTGQIEIYETRRQAYINCPINAEVVMFEVKKVRPKKSVEK
jgi:hypothetical protein